MFKSVEFSWRRLILEFFLYVNKIKGISIKRYFNVSKIKVEKGSVADFNFAMSEIQINDINGNKIR